MAKAGKRYPLVIYTHMADRWWPAILLLGLALLSLAWPLYRDPFMRLAEPWRWQAMAWLGGIVTLVSLVMASFRKSGYVQLFRDHLCAGFGNPPNSRLFLANFRSAWRSG